jgi:hypothetical protein
MRVGQLARKLQSILFAFAAKWMGRRRQSETKAAETAFPDTHGMANGQALRG